MQPRRLAHMSLAFNPSVQTVPVIGFFVFFTVKHLLADYMLQTAAMVAGKEGRRQWLRPRANVVGTDGHGWPDTVNAARFVQTGIVLRRRGE